MRQPRIKVSPESGQAVYHCMSRVVAGEHLLDDQAKEVLRIMIRKVAAFCGVSVLTYTVLSNHLHVQVQVPRKEPIGDEELLQRYAILHPAKGPGAAGHLVKLGKLLKQNSAQAIQFRTGLLALMGDLSQYMKLLKQRFCIWFNKHHSRYGTLWAERFKSVLLEPIGWVLSAVAAYIDLNCVRAGLAKDPKDYRFCGYAEAVAGLEPARCGLSIVIGREAWEEAQGAYRQRLFGTGAGPREHGAVITMEDFERVLGAGGKLSMPEVLRCRLRFLSDGAVLGGQAFVQAQLARYRQGRHATVGLLPEIADWGDLVIMHKLRGAAWELRKK